MKADRSLIVIVNIAEELFRECYDIPEHLEGYIDFERVARDIMMDHYAENGYYFHA